MKTFERRVSYMKVMRKMFQFICKNIKRASFHFPFKLMNFSGSHWYNWKYQ